jgi:hypothetical protein
VKQIPSFYVGQVYSAATKYTAVVDEAKYHEDGSVDVQITCNTADLDIMMEHIQHVTRGAAIF